MRHFWMNAPKICEHGTHIPSMSQIVRNTPLIHLILITEKLLIDQDYRSETDSLH
jgi:hypothetical protein